MPQHYPDRFLGGQPDYMSDIDRIFARTKTAAPFDPGFQDAFGGSFGSTPAFAKEQGAGTFPFGPLGVVSNIPGAFANIPIAGTPVEEGLGQAATVGGVALDVAKWPFQALGALEESLTEKDPYEGGISLSPFFQSPLSQQEGRIAEAFLEALQPITDFNDELAGLLTTRFQDLMTDLNLASEGDAARRARELREQGVNTIVASRRGFQETTDIPLLIKFLIQAGVDPLNLIPGIGFVSPGSIKTYSQLLKRVGKEALDAAVPRLKAAADEAFEGYVGALQKGRPAPSGLGAQLGDLGPTGPRAAPEADILGQQVSEVGPLGPIAPGGGAPDFVHKDLVPGAPMQGGIAPALTEEQAGARWAANWFGPAARAKRKEAEALMASGVEEDVKLGQKMYEEIVEPSRRYLQNYLEKAGYRQVVVKANVGLFEGDAEPSFFVTAMVNPGDEIKFVGDMNDIGHIDFGQQAVLVFRETTDENFRLVVPTDGSAPYSIEPFYTIRFYDPVDGSDVALDAAQLRRLSDFAAQEFNIPGLAAHPGGTGVDIIHVTKYSDYTPGASDVKNDAVYDAFQDNIVNLKIALARGEYTDKAGIPRGVPNELKAIAGEVEETSSHLWHSGAPEGWAPLTKDPSHGWDAVRRHNDPQNLQGTQNLDEAQLRDLSQRRKTDWESGKQPTELGSALAQAVDDLFLKKIDARPERVNRARVVPRHTGTSIYPRSRNIAASAKARSRIKAEVIKGLGMGGRDYYNTEWLRKLFVTEFGEEVGDSHWRDYIHYLALTSPTTDVAQNIKVGSYWRQITWDPETASPLTDSSLQAMIQRIRTGGVAPATTPSGAPLDPSDVEGIIAAGGGVSPAKFSGFGALSNQDKAIADYAAGMHAIQNEGITSPKVQGFAQSLFGGEDSIALDVHAARALGMLSDNPVQWMQNGMVDITEAQLKALGVPRHTGKGPLKGSFMDGRHKWLTRVAATDKKGQPIVKYQFNPVGYHNSKAAFIDKDALKAMPSAYIEKVLDTEYATVERMIQEIAADLTDELNELITPPMVQASLWLAMAKRTGVKGSSQGTFFDVWVEDVVASAGKTNKSKAQIVQEHIADAKAIRGLLVALIGGAAYSQLRGPSPGQQAQETSEFSYGGGPTAGPRDLAAALGPPPGPGGQPSAFSSIQPQLMGA